MTNAVDPGATPTSLRALAPDLARGGMLLLIALANVHFYPYGQPVGQRGYPELIENADRAVTFVQLMLVDGRAYPLFGLLFGYGIVQLAWRRAEVGVPVDAVTSLVRRRGRWMILIGLAHGVLLWSGDIVGSYGLLAVLMAGHLVLGSRTGLLVTAGTGVLTAALFGGATALEGAAGKQAALLPSMTMSDPLQAMLSRGGEWLGIGVAQAISVFGAVAIGAWAARRRILDEPERHRRMLTWVGVAGIAVAALGGLPLALVATGLWSSASLPATVVASALHGLAGYAGGVGYAALFGLLAIRIGRRGVGPITHALRSCGQRSLSCYLAQSVAFVALLPAWTLGLGDGAHVWQAALVGLGAWAVILVIADVSARAGLRGPAEVLLRRLTYGKPASPISRLTTS